MPRLDQSQAGFTLTEMLVSLAVASLLIVSVGQMFALSMRAYGRVSDTVERVRDYRALDRWLSVLEAADPERIEAVDGETLRLVRGVQSDLTMWFEEPGAVTVWLEHNGVTVRRDYPLSEAALMRIESGVLRLSEGDERMIASAPMVREAPFNCRYDTVAKRCR